MVLIPSYNDKRFYQLEPYNHAGIARPVYFTFNGTAGLSYSACNYASKGNARPAAAVYATIASAPLLNLATALYGRPVAAELLPSAYDGSCPTEK